MKTLTSFTSLVTGEGERIAYTFSEIDDYGNIISQNNKGSFVVVDESMKEHLKYIKNDIEQKLNANILGYKQ